MSDASLPSWQPSSAAQAEKTSKHFAQLADSVSKSISQFHEWVRLLPGVLETEYWVVDPDASQEGYYDFELEGDFSICRLGISIRRNKSEPWQLHWRLGIDCGGYIEETSDDWKPIGSANLLRRAVAVKALPELIATMEREQLRMIGKLSDAVALSASTDATKGGK